MDDLRLSQQQPEVDPEETTTHPIASAWQKQFIEKCRVKVQSGERTMKFEPPEHPPDSVLPFDTLFGVFSTVFSTEEP